MKKSASPVVVVLLLILLVVLAGGVTMFVKRYKMCIRDRISISS